MRVQQHQDIADIVDDICDTPISPELLPPKKNGEIAQITENSIGSYDYHDFFLYHMLRNAYTPAKIYMLALPLAKTSKQSSKKQRRPFIAVSSLSSSSVIVCQTVSRWIMSVYPLVVTGVCQVMPVLPCG